MPVIYGFQLCLSQEHAMTEGSSVEAWTRQHSMQRLARQDTDRRTVLLCYQCSLSNTVYAETVFGLEHL